MTPTIHFISGLPRSGSTLLCNLLAQNPRFHATASSGVLEVLFNIRNGWDTFTEFQAMPAAESEAAKLRVLRATLHAFHAEAARPVVFDKSRSWLAYLEMAELILGRPAKVLVPVRDLRDVLASFEKLYRRTAATRPVPQEAANYFDFQTIEGRCAVWARGDQPVGIAYNRIKDALRRGFADRMHFVRYEELTARPEATLRGIHEFLGEEPFTYDPTHVEQVTHEDDRLHGFVNLHVIRPRVEPMPAQWPTVLGSAAEKYAGLNLW
jgi:sulfotransferase